MRVKVEGKEEESRRDQRPLMFDLRPDGQLKLLRVPVCLFTIQLNGMFGSQWCVSNRAHSIYLQSTHSLRKNSPPKQTPAAAGLEKPTRQLRYGVPASGVPQIFAVGSRHA